MSENIVDRRPDRPCDAKVPMLSLLSHSNTQSNLYISSIYVCLFLFACTKLTVYNILLNCHGN